MKLEKENFLEILDKMLELRKSEHGYNWMQKVICIFVGIASLVVVLFLCIMMYKNNFSIESLLSLLLAFFSIFISVFFYFKASDTSNSFYDKSYDIMKDVSVTLGKIEAQFGEKLNNMNEKLGHLSHAEAEKTEALENTEDEQQKIVDDFIAKDEMNRQEKEEFVRQLQEKERKMSQLKREIHNLEIERMKLRERNMESKDDFLGFRMDKLFSICDEAEILAILEGDISKLSRRTRIMLSEADITLRDLFNNAEFRGAVKKRMHNTNTHESTEANNG